MRSTAAAFAALPRLLGARVPLWVLATAAGDKLCEGARPPDEVGDAAPIVPVLDERERLSPRLDGLVRQARVRALPA